MTTYSNIDLAINSYVDAYKCAQASIAHLKAAVLYVLFQATEPGLTNAQIGRSLGIYSGHVGHEGHISRSLLEMLKEEGVAEQDAETKRWRVRVQFLESRVVDE